MNTTNPFARYLMELDGQPCYMAGLPGYPRNFSRDTLLAGMLAGDERLLASQLAISASYQGVRDDALSGEEPGKIHHEYPGVVVNDPHLSTYNACDTTALYLIALELYGTLNPPAQQTFIQQHRPSLQAAVGYLERHIRDDIFWEFPPAGGDHYSLHTTYWKDSIVPSGQHSEEPQYPVAYALAHFQAARGVLAAARLLRSSKLSKLAEAMFITGITTFIAPDTFCVEIDASGRLEQASSDELHSLAYIPAGYVHLLPITAIWRRAEPLITPAGLACTPRDISEQLTDTYHGYVVWIFEQAFIEYGCAKFGLTDLAAIARRCIPHINDGQELLSVEPIIAPLGNTHQLWSVATAQYFQTAPASRLISYL